VPRTIFVVPCYNEAKRLRRDEIIRLAEKPTIDVLLVNDGSTDSTLEVLSALSDEVKGVSYHSMPRNRGKAEAVRTGMLRAIESGADWVGYCDADMATPASELIRLESIARASPEMSVVLASRVSLLGRDVERSVARHYLGRVFATFAGLVLGIRVYDTQCGAKLFRASPSLRIALSEPFHSRWSFDVELLGRLLHGGRGAEPLDVASFVEAPLEVWKDVDGSKLTFGSSVKSGLELAVIALQLNRWRSTDNGHPQQGPA
jgi:glycosyltransferase involved in cell wall biosynthesis